MNGQSDQQRNQEIEWRLRQRLTGFFGVFLPLTVLGLGVYGVAPKLQDAAAHKKPLTAEAAMVAPAITVVPSPIVSPLATATEVLEDPNTEELPEIVAESEEATPTL
ncbi:MAG: hypothetical protein OHK0029_35690 [Armatimonadaceae bacterium]